MIRKQPYRCLEIRLTQACNYNCSWCNQRTNLDKPMYDMSEEKRKLSSERMRSGDEWIDGLNAFPYKKEYIELIFSGGEPSLHPDFFDIVTKVKGFISKKVVTNLSFDVRKLIDACKRNRASLIVQPSFQFEEADFFDFLNKMKLLDANSLLSQIRPCSIVDLPDRNEPEIFKKKFIENGYDIAMYGFEGYYKGKFYHGDIEGFGTRESKEDVFCRSLANIVKPNGDVTFCTTDVYLKDAMVFGNICDKHYVDVPIERLCQRYGKCHVSCASYILVRHTNTLKKIWKGDNYVETNIFFYCIKNILRVFLKFRCFKFNIKKYTKYLKLHLFST